MHDTNTSGQNEKKFLSVYTLKTSRPLGRHQYMYLSSSSDFLSRRPTITSTKSMPQIRSTMFERLIALLCAVTTTTTTATDSDLNFELLMSGIGGGEILRQNLTVEGTFPSWLSGTLYHTGGGRVSCLHSFTVLYFVWHVTHGITHCVLFSLNGQIP